MSAESLTFGEVVEWLHGRLGKRVVLSVAFEAGLPAIVTYGTLQRGVDPRHHDEGRDLVDDTDDLLLFNLGTNLAGTLFALSRRRFGAAWVGDEYGGTLFVGQQPVVLSIRRSIEGDPGHELA